MRASVLEWLWDSCMSPSNAITSSCFGISHWDIDTFNQKGQMILACQVQFIGVFMMFIFSVYVFGAESETYFCVICTALCKETDSPKE